MGKNQFPDVPTFNAKQTCYLRKGYVRKGKKRNAVIPPKVICRK